MKRISWFEVTVISLFLMGWLSPKLFGESIETLSLSFTSYSILIISFSIYLGITMAKDSLAQAIADNINKKEREKNPTKEKSQE